MSRSREAGRLPGKRLIRVLIAPEENGDTFPPGFPLGASTSRGHLPGYEKAQSFRQSTPTALAKLLAQRMRRKYKPRCRIQRYCQEPDCLRQVRRWQAARRQAKRRRDAEIRAQHAEAEKDAPSANQSCVPAR